MKMRLNNKVVVSAIVLLAIITATSTAAFADAEVNIKADGTMSTDRVPFPAHWGPPPLRQTRDYVQLPEPYGRGSSTIRKWIEEKMAEDAAAADEGTGRRFANPDSKWPDKSLIGMTGEEAEQEIHNVDPSLEVQIIPEDSMVTMDYREDRVRIFVNADGKVVDQPHKG
mmetsp:Transcript_16203/g.26596  ORF Transcript_16203/g.26596 Transcript_16203/m.26596 type:complete len:169 (-) Transcript_16203:178-684(-)